jgi:putative colanic acid biosynthesis acetyltransferase WcaF
MVAAMTQDAEPLYPRLADYAEPAEHYDRGRGRLWQITWLAVQSLGFAAWWFPRTLRPVVLRAFGAKVGANVVIRHKVRVQWPWKLVIGNDTWVGEESWLYNAGHLTIGSDVCLSQGVFLVAGDHDRGAADFHPREKAIVVEDGVWLAAQSMVLGNVTVGSGTVVGGRAIVSRDVPRGGVVRVGTVH